MPETPDFDQIAQQVAESVNSDEWQMMITEWLRLVWNARGAADIATLETELPSLMGEIAYRLSTYGTSLDRALRTLDR